MWRLTKPQALLHDQIPNLSACLRETARRVKDGMYECGWDVDEDGDEGLGMHGDEGEIARLRVAQTKRHEGEEKVKDHEDESEDVAPGHHLGDRCLESCAKADDD